MNGDQEFVYKVKNVYAKSERFIWFFSDPPHLIKTARNCLSKSGSSNRRMWIDGMEILWSHITSLYYENLEFGLSLVPKLSNNHINLTSYSVMNVRLAAQVLSESVGTVLAEFGPPESAATAKFCLYFDKFFDCLNVRNTREHKFKNKPFLQPYVDVCDERFTWLESFLDYLDNWKASIERRPGSFSPKERGMMFLSHQTYEGIKMTINSFKECVIFLLQHGVKYVLSERFCQDDLENYFGRQRAIGRRQDNPRVFDVGYNDNIIKTQYSIRPISGNVQAGEKWNQISDQPLPKRRKSTKVYYFSLLL